MLATQMVVLATIAIVDGTRVSIQENLAAERLAKTKDTVGNGSSPTNSGPSPQDISLELAAKTGDVAALAQHGQAGSDLDEKLDSLGWTAAHYAARYGHVAALKVLHEAPGACSELLFQNGSRTPAYLAAKEQAKALEALAEARAALRRLPQKQTDLGKSRSSDAGRRWTDPAAHAAAKNCKVDALRVLIQAGVNINDTDFEGQTPFDDAASGDGADCYEALQLLVQESLKLGGLVGTFSLFVVLGY
ncbi:ANKRD52 [Symbiodinium sp. CCMP2456]|nr:ANKRD52 [Symbiodinium sp. CCMP2456]